MAPRLNGYTQVNDVWYGPDDDIPADVAAKIGPHAWVNGEHPDAAAFVDYIASLNADTPVPATPAEQSAEPTGHGGTGGGDGGQKPPKPPPMSGRGSGESEWRAYAETVKFDADQLAKLEKRDDIVEALRTAGFPVDRTAD